MSDVASRLRHRVQLTTDGHEPSLAAIEGAFGADIDCATLTKLYGNDPEGKKRYSPAKCIGTTQAAISGDPNPKHVSTSYVERRNLTMRMSISALSPSSPRGIVSRAYAASSSHASASISRPRPRAPSTTAPGSPP